jgi:D-cysteine desulfhydrase
MKKFAITYALLLVASLELSSSFILNKYANLKNHIAHLNLCDLPTPITRLTNLEKAINYAPIYLKRDDLTGKSTNNKRLYGGNKVRKLEWLLADAIQKGAHTVVTYGCAGSNHALATATYAQTLGLKAILMLKPQPISHVVRQNLMNDLHVGAEIRYFMDNDSRELATKELLANDPEIYFIPTGGSNELGTIGYVDAIFELCTQIQNQVLPKPDLIYVPMGSVGTVTGLLLGLALSKLDTKIIALAVEPETIPGFYVQQIKDLFALANQLLHSKDQNINLVDFPAQFLAINNKFSSPYYGAWTSKDQTTINLLQNLEKIKLEGTYSSKPFSAFLDDVQKQNITNKTVLIWNTYCDLDSNNQINKINYSKLPASMYYYFNQK